MADSFSLTAFFIRNSRPWAITGELSPSSGEHMKKDLLAITDLTSKDIEKILKRSGTLKELLRRGKPHQTLKGKSLGMIFEKASTRTRVSFEVGMFQLGGQALFLSPNDLQIGRGEPIADPARTPSRYLDGIMI